MRDHRVLPIDARDVTTDSSPAALRTVFVLGATGQVGRYALPRLVGAGSRVVALSRGSPPPDAPREPAVRWLCGDLGGTMPAVEDAALLSLGPLDAMTRWLVRAAPPALRRVVALSSTSVHVKANSSDAAERDVAARLAGAEQELRAYGAKRDIACTILRPTLIYGAGSDRTLSRIAAIAMRLGFVALPRAARGLRQPVHADDLAIAALAALARDARDFAAYDLPGGETLRYDEMVERVLASLPRRARLLRVPDIAFGTAAAIARSLGVLHGLEASVIARMADDLVFDASAARRDLGYAPRAFAPEAGAFAS
jgi:nucleoside-diphosphate-sugar epimerase